MVFDLFSLIITINWLFFLSILTLFNLWVFPKFWGVNIQTGPKSNGKLIQKIDNRTKSKFIRCTFVTTAHIDFKILFSKTKPNRTAYINIALIYYLLAPTYLSQFCFVFFVIIVIRWCILSFLTFYFSLFVGYNVMVTHQLKGL